MRINFRRKVNIDNKRDIAPVVNFAVIQLAQIARVALDVFKQFLVILQKKEIIIMSCHLCYCQPHPHSHNPPPHHHHPHHHHLQVEQHRGISKAKGSSAAETSGLCEHLPLVVSPEC